MKRKLLFLVALVASALGFNANAQTDVTNKASGSWTGEAGNYTPNAGSVTLKENYVTNTTETGKILYQTVSGLDEGYYKVTLYANASYTPGRGFVSAATDGDLDCTFIYAQGDGELVKVGIPMNYGQYVSLSGEATVTAHVGSAGTLEFGITKDKDGSNWHSIGVKSISYYGNDTEIIKGELADEIKTAGSLSVAETEQGTLTEAIAVAQVVADKSDATFTEIEGAIRELQIAEKFAKGGFSAATINNPVTTDFVQNGNFANYDSKDWPTGGWVSLCNVTNHGRKNDNGAWENWKEKSEKLYGKMFNRMTNIPNGAYSLSIDAFCDTEGAAYVYANGERKTVVVTANNVLTTYEIPVVVKNNILEVGLYAGSTSWAQIHNVSVSYTGDPLASYKSKIQDLLEVGEELATKVEGITSAFVDPLTKALNDYKDYASYNTEEECTTAISDLQTAIDNLNIYIVAKDKLDAMKEFTESNNVYTEDGYGNYYGQWIKKFNDGTLTIAEAVALEYPTARFEYKGVNNVDDLLLSAWTIGGKQAKDYETALYINTWSLEGDNDGSDFQVPFFEYWAADANSLGANNMSATITGLNDGVYEVTALIRVRTKDNVAAADAKGITLSLNDGDAVDVTKGEKTFANKAGFFILDEYTATGIVTDGTLVINFDVAEENNISWLAFKNVKYTKVDTSVTITDAMGYATYVTPANVSFTDDVKAYIVESVDDGIATLQEIETAVKGTPVIIKAEKPDTYELYGVAEADDYTEINQLKAATADITETEGLYVLANLTEGIGFYALEEGVKIPAGKAYLDATDFDREIKFIGFGSGTATAIKGLETSAEDAVIYNIAGQRVANPTKGGIYIVNGKKVLVK